MPSEVLSWPEGGPTCEDFVEHVRAEGERLYRALPWRFVDDAYAVLVSEVMLQQTQVARVEKFWRRFLAAFPSVDALAAASTSDVLEMWQGLGYNRRALALKRAAEECSARYAGELPQAFDELVALPGIGPATAAGVRAFAWQLPGVYLETNVRAVFLYELFPEADKVPDRVLIPLVEATCPPAPTGASSAGLRGRGEPTGVSEDELVLQDAACGYGGLEGSANAAADLRGCGEPTEPDGASMGPREWYYALLDYGAHLKATGENPTRRSAHYARQAAFEGSRRQKRSWIVRRVLAADAQTGVRADVVAAELSAAERACGRDGVDEATFRSIVDDLVREGFFQREGNMLRP